VKITDTHTHIYQPDFDKDIDEVIERAKSSGVSKILLPNIDVESIELVNRLSDSYSGYCFPMMGLHPTSVTRDWINDLELIRKQFSLRKYIGVGEIGIDLYWDKTLEKEQKAAFEEQLAWSVESDLPVSIHSRDAIIEAIDSIKRVGASKIRGVFHSFGGTETELKEILSLGDFYLGINGVVTFKNSTLSAVLKNTDLSRIVIETDAPYLAPVPYRGKRNEPSYCLLIAEKLGGIFNVPSEEVAKITSENANRIFACN